MIPQFIIYFLCTGIIVRILTPPLHFRNRTVTGYLRHKTQKEIHHFHFGILIFFIAIGLLLFKGEPNNLIILSGAVGLSLMADEIFIRKDYSEYFKKYSLWYSVIAHIIIGISAIAILLIAF